MSNYTKTTDFEAKDSLPTGDSGKIIRGAEFETEFDAISTAIATKADTAGPTFTGTLTFDTISDGTIGVTAFVDEDDMVSDSATLVPTQQSVKAYVDSQVTAQDLDFQADSGGALSIDLDSEALTLTGGTGIDTSGALNEVTFAIDSTVATLTGTQTLTNKTLTSPDVNTPDIDGGTIDGTVIGGTTPAAVSATTVSATGNITVGGTVDGRDVAADGTKLDGIEAGATADQTAAEIRTLVESATDSNVFTDADHTKLDGIEANATADQTAAEIRTLVEAATDSNVFTDADHTKLDGIEASADVTDTANVTAAGALMDSELTDIAAVKALNQGVATTDSPTFAGLTTTANVSFGDNDKAIFGAGSDLQIYHDGSNSIVQDSGAGNLQLRGASFVIMQSDEGENMVRGQKNAGVRLYYDNATKLDTTSTGIDVTGTVTADGLNLDGNIQGDTGQNMQISAGAGLGDKLDLRAGDDVRIYVDGASAHKLAANFSNNGDISFYEDTGTTAKLFWDASAESLGIGTTSPNVNLDIENTGSPQIRVTDTGGSATTKLMSDTVRGYVGSQTNVDFAILTNNQVRATFDTSGNVGIGTSSPAFAGSRTGINIKGTTANGVEAILLDSTDSGNAGFALVKDGVDAFVYNRTNGIMGFGTNNTERMRIDSSGNVEIGTQATGTASSKQLLSLVNPYGNTGGAARLWLSGTNATTRGAYIEAEAQNSANQHDLIFATSAVSASPAERMRIDSSGNVGIGTASPSFKLDVAGNARASYFALRSNESAPSESSFIYRPATGVLGFGTGTAERMRIDSSGNLLVGQTSADSNSVGIGLLSNGTAYAVRDGSAAFIAHRKSSDGNIVEFLKDNTTVGSIGVNNGTNLYIGADGQTGLKFGSTDIVPADSNNSGASSDADMNLGNSSTRFKDLYLSGAVKVPAASKGIEYSSTSFITPENNTSGAEISTAGTLTVKTGSTPSLAMTVDGSGNLLVGKSGTTLANTGTEIRATGFIRATVDSATCIQANRITGTGTAIDLRYAGTSVGSIAVGVSSTTYNTSSDQRLKDNIVDAPSASDDIDAIQVRSFDWKADGSHQKYGMVAQELQSVAPEAVSGDADSDEMMGVDYSKLVPMLVKEIQSLRARVAQLEGAN